MTKYKWWHTCKAYPGITCSQPERYAFGLQSTVARNIADLTKFLMSTEPKSLNEWPLWKSNCCSRSVNNSALLSALSLTAVWRNLCCNSWLLDEHLFAHWTVKNLCTMRMRYQLCSSVDVERCNDRSSWRSIMVTCLAPRSSSLFKENFTDSADVW